MKPTIRSLFRRLGPLIRSGAASAMYHSGILSNWLKRTLDHRAVVLMYHRVLPDDQIEDSPSHPGIIVSTDTFEMQMRCLRERFQILTPDAFHDHIKDNREFPSMSCLVTFDDGWVDNRHYALPILRKYDIEPLIFLAAGFIGTERRFWQESMTETILDLRQACSEDGDLRSRIEQDPVFAGLNPCLVAGDDAARDGISRFVPAWKRRPTSEIEEFINSLRALIPKPSCPVHADRHFLNWEEVRQMQDQGVVFGNHGLNHRILTNPETDTCHEIREADGILEQRLGRSVEYMSYPNGNYDQESRDQARNCGYRLAFSTRRGHISVADDRFTLRRNNMYEGGTRTLPMFLARIQGIW